jgi:hypothetical protein
MAKARVDYKAVERRLIAAQVFNETDPEKANQMKDQAVVKMLKDMGLVGLAMAYDNVEKLYENQTRHA